MFSLIEALDFRCLRHVYQRLGPFHVLVGPNASGKTTFLDVVSFLGQLVSNGLDAAVSERTRNFTDLVWDRQGDRIELALEARIPEELRWQMAEKEHDTVRYEVAVGVDPDTREVNILAENVLSRASPPEQPGLRMLFPVEPDRPETIIAGTRGSDTRALLSKVPGGNDNFYSEVRDKRRDGGGGGGGWSPSFKLGPRKSALGNLPGDEAKFPVSTWLRELLAEGVQKIMLNSLAIRKASPPGQVRGFKPDGSNLPWVVEDLRKSDSERFAAWIAHLKTALPDIEDVHTVERQDDKHRYLVLDYSGGLQVPSWMASDGTLRLLALTLPAYLPAFKGVYLIEEPENGIHPRAVETLFQSLSSAYDAQILAATHSPVILSIAKVDTVLCFSKTPQGATDIVSGSEHPKLRDWQGETNLGVLFAAGVLG